MTSTTIPNSDDNCYELGQEFKKLASLVPTIPKDGCLSELEFIEFVIAYIRQLQQLLSHDQWSECLNKLASSMKNSLLTSPSSSQHATNLFNQFIFESPRTQINENSSTTRRSPLATLNLDNTRLSSLFNLKLATAIENTIPCDRCDSQIDLQDWSEHIRRCSDNRDRPATREKRRSVDDKSNNDRIPCEYCSAPISVNDWKSHSKTCAEEHTRRLDRLRNNTSNEPVDASIPCEYCNDLISIHNWEWHMKRCVDEQRNRNKTSQKDELVLIPCEHCNIPVIADDWEWHTRQCGTGPRNDNKTSQNDGSVLIPCEYCGTSISAQEWERHTKNCAEADKKRVADMAKRISKESSDALIPCEYCQESFPMGKITAHEKKCRRKQTGSAVRPDTPTEQASGSQFNPPDHWDDSNPKNLTRYDVAVGTEEYKFVADRFHETLKNNQIARIERIQNRRWYRQYQAHKDDFIERYDKSTEQWLFHGCRKAESAEAIIGDCFNRSHAVNCAVGQGIYFATQAAVSYGYTRADSNGLRHMFLACVLVGKTTRGDRTTRVCPPGFDTTGGGNVFVTYHDAQAYAQYLIIFR